LPFIALAVSAAMLGAAAAAPESPAVPARATAADPASLVRRTTLIVHDVDASIRFYRDVLGFELWLDNRGKVSASSLPSRARVGEPSRFVIMKGRHPWVGMVGLLQYGAAQQTPKPPRRLVPGDAVLMLETQDLAGIWARMQRAGTPIHKPPQTSEVEGAGGARWRATFLFAWDPDGHMLEINQREPIVLSAAPAAGEVSSADVDTAAVRVLREYRPMRWGQLHLRRAMPTAAAGMHAPVVLLHQTPLSGRMFSELLPVLGRDRVVYAPDTPGYGESDGPPAVTTLDRYVEALHDVLGELKEPIDLVGYHTGALLAAEYAARYPTEVRRLVLISMPLFSAERRAKLNTTTLLTEDGSHLLGEWRSTMSVRPPGQSLEQAARIVAEKQRAGTRAGWAMAAVAAYEPEARLRAIRVPTTLIRPKDGLWEAGGEAAALIPGARLVDAPQWGFGLFDSDPPGVAAQIKGALD
jgi:pimeloyl-ACP methyl ester carboxylesterase/catechol 2,3-dioxygenase-like lactoylglutathione lyase family enzyme